MRGSRPRKKIVLFEKVQARFAFPYENNHTTLALLRDRIVSHLNRARKDAVTGNPL